MKSHFSILALFSVLVFTSCTKQPEACISGPATAEVFETVTFTSCSEDAESVEWEVQQNTFSIFLISTTMTPYYTETITPSWLLPGNYSLTLTALSKNEKKTDNTSATIIVSDLCYSCIYTSSSYSYTEEICAADGFYTSESSFMSDINYLEQNGYICTKQ